MLADIQGSIETILTIIASSLVTLLAVFKKNRDLCKFLVPNGGSSLADKIDSIVSKLDGLNTWRFAWMDLSDQVIFETDEHGQIRWINGAFVRLFKRKPSALLGRGWMDFIHPEDKELIVKDWHSDVSSATGYQSTFRLVINDQTISVNCRSQELAKDVGYIGTFDVLSTETHT